MALYTVAILTTALASITPHSLHWLKYSRPLIINFHVYLWLSLILPWPTASSHTLSFLHKVSPQIIKGEEGSMLKSQLDQYTTHVQKVYNSFLMKQKTSVVAKVIKIEGLI